MKRPDIEHEGIITGISESHIFVRIIQHSACAGCHAASLCTTTDQKEKIIEVEKCDFPLCGTFLSKTNGAPYTKALLLFLLLTVR